MEKFQKNNIKSRQISSIPIGLYRCQPESRFWKTGFYLVSAILFLSLTVIYVYRGV